MKARCFVHEVMIDGFKGVLELDADIPEGLTEEGREVFMDGFAQGVTAYLNKMQHVEVKS